MDRDFDMQIAIEEGDFEKFRELFEPSDIDFFDESTGSWLHTAATFGTIEIAKFLVENGVKVNRLGGTFDAPAITYAAREGKLDIVEYLFDAGSKLDLSHAVNNPLVQAAGEGHFDVVEFLLTTDIDPHATYRVPAGNLINALTKAEGRGHTKVAELLKSHGCHHPVEGVDIPLWEPASEQEMDQNPESGRAREIIEYMEKQFGPADKDGMQELIPVMDEISVSINIIPPNEAHPYLVIFTNGMSDLPMEVPKGQEASQYAELVMHLPADWPHPRDAISDPQWIWPVQWLRKLAYIPHLNETWLGLPAAIVSSDDPPVPLGPNTKQTCMLLIPDHENLDPPLTTSDGTEIHFHTVTPLYTEERDFELEHGMKAFFERFSEKGVSLIVDVDRPNFVTE